MAYTYFDKDGTPLNIEMGSPESLKLWSEEYRRVAQDYVGEIHVSTVFLPIDHGWGEGPPVIFETMVFGYADHDEYQWRYCTEEQALAGHAKILQAVKDRTLDEVEL